MSAKSLRALVRLRDTDVIPEAGFQEPRFNVSLTSDHKMRTAWRGEIKVGDSRPWCRGEERRVELSIEAQPFADYVTSWRPTLYVCRDNQIIGLLTLAENGDFVDSAPAGGQ